MPSNPCARCGKERIFSRSWKETFGNSVVTTTENACPDTECQKIVEKDNKNRIEKYKSAQLRRKANLKNGRKNIAKEKGVR